MRYLKLAILINLLFIAVPTVQCYADNDKNVSVETTKSDSPKVIDGGVKDLSVAAAATDESDKPASDKPASDKPTTVVVSTETQAWWMRMLELLLNAFITIITPVLALLVTIFLRRWKLNVELDTVDKIVSKAVGFGEQKAKQALKSGKPMEGPEIAKVALGLAEDLSTRYKLPNKAKDKLVDLIEAKLGEKELERKDSVFKPAEPLTASG